MANLAIVPALVGQGRRGVRRQAQPRFLIDAVQLSRADSQRYAHGDLVMLERLLAKSNAKRKLIVSDAVFSMDGDLAPLPELLELAERRDAWLVVDDAHGFGVLGEQGRGSLAHFAIDPSNPRLVEHGHPGGAAGVGRFRRRLRNADRVAAATRARTYIFTTGSSPLIA